MCGENTMNPIQNERLRLYLEAEKAVLLNQSYTIAGQTYTRANLATIRAAIDDLVAAGATLDEPGGVSAPVRKTRHVVFLD